MRQALLISVAALALAAGSNAALSQGGAKGGGTTGGTISAPQANPGGAGTGATTPGNPQGQINESPAPGHSAHDRTIPEKRKSSERAPGQMQQGQAEHGKSTSRHEKSAEQGGQDHNGKSADHPAQKNAEGRNQNGGTKQGAAERPMKSSNVSLTNEQKTTIRTKVLTRSAPRVNNVTFDIRVGTVVPRHVHIVPVPPALVTIEPEWRGYRYFVYEDEVIIVNPRTLAIVAVLPV